MTQDNLNPKRVLVLTSTFPRWKGDSEPPFVFELSKRLGQQFRVIALCPHAPNAKLAEELEGVEVRRFRYFFTPWQRLAYDGGILANLKKNRLNYLLIPFFILSELINAVRLIRRLNIDVVHAHWIIPQGLVAVMARLLAYPRKPAIICTSHGGDLFGLSGRVPSWIKRQVLKRVDKLTVVSQAMREYAFNISNRDDIGIISMGVDLVRTFSLSPEVAKDPNVILFVGRLVEKKGVRYLLLAMPEILKHHPQATVLIVGDGPERAALEELAVVAGIKSHVRFLGMVDNASLPELYRRAAIFVAPSIVAQGGDQEGLGLVLVEALGCGCAVIASDLPAIQDVVTEGVTGLVCRQKNSEDLARRVRSLLDHPQTGEKLGHAGRQHVIAHYDWQTVSQRYRELIEGLNPGKR